jgi:hypothetical protein
MMDYSDLHIDPDSWFRAHVNISNSVGCRNVPSNVQTHLNCFLFLPVLLFFGGAYLDHTAVSEFQPVPAQP